MSWVQVWALLCISCVSLGQTLGPQFQNQMGKEAFALSVSQRWDDKGVIWK